MHTTTTTITITTTTGPIPSNDKVSLSDHYNAFDVGTALGKILT